MIVLSRGKANVRASQASRSMRILAVLLLILLVSLMVLQGGFFQESTVRVLVVYCVCFLMLSLFRLFLAKRNDGNNGSCVLLFTDRSIKAVLEETAIPLGALIIALLFAVSVLFHGLPVHDLIYSAAWVLAAFSGFSCMLLSSEDRSSLLKGIVWVGVVTSIIGFAIYSEIVFIPGNLHAGRLQFFFQYANAAGAWFAVSALLCMTDESISLRKLAFFPFAALLFTQSMGSICMLVVVTIVFLAIELYGTRRKERAKGNVGAYRDTVLILSQAVLAVFSFLLLKHDLLLGAMVYLAAAIFFVSVWTRVSAMLGRDRIWKIVSIVAFAACVIAALLFTFFDHARVTQSLATFVERVVQAKDALLLLAQDLLFGVGPDQWQYRYFDIRSEDYIATQVHNAYLQLGLDAGIFAVLAFMAMFVYSIIRSFREGNACIWASLLFLFLHCFVDFDMNFSFFVVLSCMLMSLCSPCEHEL